jgi:chromosomal replication initiation ATPase DnaA
MIHTGTLGLSPARSRQHSARKERLARIAQAAVRQEQKADEAQVKAIETVLEAPPVEVAPEPAPQPIAPAYIVQSKIATIQCAVAKEFNLPIEIMTAPSRRQGFVRPRQVAMYLCRKFLPHVSLPQIGRRFGWRDHTTILHGANKISRLLKFDLELAAAVRRVEAELVGLGGAVLA